ncbi:MAG: DegV family protein [Chloroflexi bacterium]|nr:DegV family protein [Chloroflexota bacterium]
MVVRVVTDSTSDLPRELAESLGVTVVPLKVHFGEETLRDGVDISAETFYQRLKASSVLPTTSQPSPGEFEAVFRQVWRPGDAICAVVISSKLSGTYSSALTAKGLVESEIPVEVVDSELVAMALGLVVIRTAKAAAAGADLAECARIARETSAHTEILFFVDTLEYLRRGGRIGKASAFLGTLLNIKPLLALKGGEVVPVERTRSRQKALERLEEWIRGHPRISALCVFSSPPADEADQLAERLRQAYPEAPLFRGTLGPVVGTHAGPGLVGAAVYSGPPLDTLP